MEKQGSKPKNRIAIFALLDPDGVIDGCVELLLQSICPNISKVYGIISESADYTDVEKMSGYCAHLIKIDSSKRNSFDSYKYGIENIGWQEIENYDELVLFDSEILGEVNPFQQMYKEMDQRDDDFWGIAFKYFESEDGNYSEYLPPYYLSVGKRIFGSPEFKTFWENKHKEDWSKELCLVLSKKGYHPDEYVDTEDLSEYTPDPMIFDALKLIKNKKCPVFEKKLFSYDYSVMINRTNGYRVRHFLDYLEKSGKYNVDLIWESILRTENQEDIVRNLGLTYIVDEFTKEKPTNLHAALIMHIYYKDLIEHMISYASNAPQEVDIIITTVGEENRIAIQNEINKQNVKNKTIIRVIENRGRDVSSLLVGTKDVIKNYDVACFIHDKKTPQLKNRSEGEDFGQLCYENLLPNRGYISEVISLFENNTRLGMLVPPFPSFGALYTLVGNEWSYNYKNTVELADELKISVPICEEKRPIAPYGTCFWFRTKALDKLIARNWEFKDFPEEPNKMDGTVLHAVERIYPYVVQDAGYYPAVLMSKTGASIEYQKLDYFLSENKKKLTKIFGLHDFNADQSYLDDIVYQSTHGNKKAFKKDKERVRHQKGFDYFVKDLLHVIMPNKLFEAAINYKRRLFGPYKDYTVKDDKRYM